jgi:hypothetical protein
VYEIDLRTNDFSERYFLLSRTVRRPLDAIKTDRAFVRSLAAGVGTEIGHGLGCELAQGGVLSCTGGTRPTAVMLSIRNGGTG